MVNYKSIKNIHFNKKICNTIDLKTSGAMINMFYLSSRNVWRYIIEDIIFISTGQLVIVIVDVESCNSVYWERITKIQKFDYDNVTIGRQSFYQILSWIWTNNRKDEFVSGHHDNDKINYILLNKGL